MYIIYVTFLLFFYCHCKLPVIAQAVGETGDGAQAHTIYHDLRSPGPKAPRSPKGPREEPTTGP